MGDEAVANLGDQQLFDEVRQAGAWRWILERRQAPKSGGRARFTMSCQELRTGIISSSSMYCTAVLCL
jgi:hypothetical protein